MYYINKFSIINNIVLRGNYLTKKILKKNSKQTLIFLRSPKHFNIGKHKVSSFLNYKKYKYNLNYKIFTNHYLINQYLLFNIFIHFHKLHFLFNISSIRSTIKTKIKW